jgi:hypothetical protein
MRTYITVLGLSQDCTAKHLDANFSAERLWTLFLGSKERSPRILLEAKIQGPGEELEDEESCSEEEAGKVSGS